MATEETQVVSIDDSEVLPPDIQQRIQEAKRQNNALMQMMKELMQEGIDYGRVPGVSKPFLHQPGAQQLGLVFKFRPEFEKIDSVVDFEQEPIFLSYEYKCRLYHKETGTFLGEGVGSCNNYEKKYKYYKDGKLVEDPLDKQNTLVKMAKKRAYVDATLNVTGASRLFAQDADLVEYDTEGPDKGNRIPEDPGEYKMPFGVHKGTKLKNMDNGYLKWVAEKMTPKNETGEEAQEAVKKFLAEGTKVEKKTSNKKKSGNKGESKSGSSNSSKNIKEEEQKSTQKQNRISELNELVNGYNDLWDVVKDYLDNELGDRDVKGVNELSDKQWNTLVKTLENMIPEDGELDLEDDEFDVPF